jgi:predicted ABC-type ATPase
MVAGPNGSGKSTLLDVLLLNPGIPLGFVLNPDVLESQLRASGQMDLSLWSINTTHDSFSTFFENHPLWPQIGQTQVKVHNNRIELSETLKPGYFVAVLCDFMRREWIKSRTSFTFETVMSSRDKPLFLHEARGLGYKTYLYFICTQDALINHERVLGRVRKGGHPVPADKITQRYKRSLSLLKLAVENSDRAFLFDNSSTHHSLVAEFENGHLKKLHADPPEWVHHALSSE